MFYRPCVLFLLAHGLQAFNEHIPADYTQHQHVGQIDEEIGVAELAQDLYDLYAGSSSDHSPREEKQAHFEIHVAQPKMGKCSGGGCPNNLVGVRCGGNCRGNTHHDQKRRHQKPAAYSKNTR